MRKKTLILNTRTLIYTTHFLSVLHLCHFAPEEAQRAKRVLPSTFTEVKGLISHYYIYYWYLLLISLTSCG